MRLAFQGEIGSVGQQGPGTQIRHCPERTKDKDRGEGGQDTSLHRTAADLSESETQTVSPKSEWLNQDKIRDPHGTRIIPPWRNPPSARTQVSKGPGPGLGPDRVGVQLGGWRARARPTRSDLLARPQEIRAHDKVSG